MLSAYFDESGHESDSLLVMAGLLGSADEWTTFEGPWADALSLHGLPYFHASKMNRNIGPLCKGWSAEKMNAYMALAVAAITDRDLLTLSSAVRTADYNNVIGGHPWLTKRFGSAYRLLYESCIQATYKWMEKNPNVSGEKVSIFFSNNTEFGGAARVQGKRYVDWEMWSERIASVTSASFTDTLPLQAADLIAYEEFKVYSKVLLNEGPDVPRVSYRRLRQEMAMAPETYWNEEALFNLAAQIAVREQQLGVIEYLLEFGKRYGVRNGVI